MNFTELRQYKHAYLLFEKWVERNFDTVLSIQNGLVRNEDIIEFLDSKKVMIECAAVDSWDIWMYRIILEDSMSPFFIAYSCNYEYVSRKQATEAAILKAFVLLNDTQTV